MKSITPKLRSISVMSLPSRECGLKSFLSASHRICNNVTPFAGVWIEISYQAEKYPPATSLPSRECGLKLLYTDVKLKIGGVTPFAGVWIEIASNSGRHGLKSVTPFAGVWIEIMTDYSGMGRAPVTPFAGVWIEMECMRVLKPEGTCHSLRGSVD